MKKFVRICISFVCGGFFIYLVYLNSAVYYSPRFEKTAEGEYNAGLLEQLRYLKDEVHGSAGDEMQKLYPEGYFFMHVLYGLSWCELARSLKPGSPLLAEARKEAGWALKQVESEKAKNIFDPELPVPYGAFCQGWTNYLRAKLLQLLPETERPAEEMVLLDSTSAMLARYLDTQANPYVESYPGQSWPADITVAVASLAVYDQFREKKYAPVIRRWIGKVKKHLDPSGLVPHQVDAGSGECRTQALGSSQSLMLGFFAEIDRDFAKAQLALYKEHFLASRFGLPGIREYRHGSTGFAHIDSGPVLLGIGGSASVVGCRSMALLGESATAEGLRNSIEAFGMAHSSNGKKNYLFGAVPVADAFIAWTHSTEYDSGHRIGSTGCWQWKFHLWSLLVFAPFLLVFQRVWRRWPWKKKKHDA